MTIGQGTIITILVYFIFTYVVVYMKKQALFKISACIMFMIGFGLIMPSATNDTEMGVAVAGILFSIGLGLVHFIVPDSKAKKGRIF